MRRLSVTLLFTLLLTSPSWAATFIVNDPGDASDATPGNGICATAGAVCTLRAAIEEANASAGADTIQFAAGMTIPPATPYTITSQVTIDGTTTVGYVAGPYAAPVVVINGFNVGLGQGFVFNAGSASSAIRGLKIHGYASFAIQLNADSITVDRNYVGPVDGAGLANGVGVDVSVTNGSVIGGADGQGNVISGNTSDGIRVTGASGTIIRNNRIGMNPAGTNGVANGGAGVALSGNATNFDIGGLNAGEGNVISFNGTGINGSTISNGRIYGNTIGLNAARDDIRGNSGRGISLSTATNITVGNTGLGRNYVSGNSMDGIFLGLGTGYLVQHNYIGTDGTGNVGGVGNSANGITIGAATSGTVQNNVISGNGMHGIALGDGSSGIAIHSNLIGVGADGTTALANTGDGINLADGAAGAVVGDPATPNTIRNNGAAGIGLAENAGANNRFAGNSIDSNTGLGIDLMRNGPTPNDPQDADAGPNLLQNWPQFVAAVSTPTASTVRGTINTRPNELVALHFYTSPAADPTGYGEGRLYLGTMNVTTDALGDAPFVFTGSPATVGHELTATATGITSSSGTSEFALTTAVDPAPALAFELAAYNVAEAGGTATIKVVRTGQIAVTSTVQYATSNGTATAGADYTAASGTLTFAPGETEQTFVITIANDLTDEPNETVNLTLSNPGVASITPPATVQLTITDNDLPPTISISDVALAEGNAGTTNFIFTVSLSTPSAFQVEFDYLTANDTATAGSDYTTTGAHGIIPANTPSMTITVPVAGDATFEPNETFFVNLTNALNATFSDAQGLGTINNDEAALTLIIGDVTLAEGNAGTTAFTFTITQSGTSGSNTTVNYATADNTAIAPGDYTAVPITQATIPANSTSTTVTVNVNGDTLVEGDETFFVNLSGASGAAIADNQALGTITNDEGVPTLIINDVTLAEGNAGTTALTFTITQSALSASNTTVNYATANNTATSPSDYTATSGTATITANTLTTTVTVNVNGDTLFESNESFFVNLSAASGATINDAQGAGTINNDEATPTLIINDVTLAEGNAGTTAFTFTITQSAVSGSNTTVSYETANNTAVAPGDYATTGGVATITANTLSTTVTVNVVGDTVFEPTESFFVNLVGSSGPTISDGQGLGTITNDDVASANLNLTKTANTSTFTPGQQVTFTITATNGGPASATNVVVTDVLPANTTLVSATPSQGTCSGTTTVVCNIGTLANNASATVSLVVVANGTQSISNTATVAATEADPTPGNNTASAAINPGGNIPTASEWGLILLLLGLAVLAMRRL